MSVTVRVEIKDDALKLPARASVVLSDQEAHGAKGSDLVFRATLRAMVDVKRLWQGQLQEAKSERFRRTG